MLDLKSRRSNKSIVPAAQQPLVGKYFHSIENKDGHNIVQWQGQVMQQINPEVYLVELFEWLTGSSSFSKLVPLAEMLHWQFYDDAEQMKDWYEHSYRPPEPKRKRYPQVS